MKSLAVLAAFALVLAGSAGSKSMAAPAQPAWQTFHVELNTLQGCYRGGCDSIFSEFSDKDITVLQGGRRYPAQVVARDKPDFPAHLLVMFATGARRPRDGALASQLEKPLSMGWLVSVARNDGTFTPFCSKGMLAQALARSPAASPGGKTEILPHAIETLEAFPGRRVLLFVSDRKVAVPKWVTDAASQLAPIYVVDGGHQEKHYYSISFGAGWGLDPDWKAVTSREFHDGIMHEIKLSSAMKHIVADSRCEYDLSFSIPASDRDGPAAPSRIRVELDTRRAVTASGFAVSIPSSMQAELYRVAEEGSGTAAPARIAIAQDIAVIWRISFGRFPTVLFHLAGDTSQTVLPHFTPPDGTVEVPYGAWGDFTGGSLESVSPQIPIAGPQTLKIEDIHQLGIEVHTGRVRLVTPRD